MKKIPKLKPKKQKNLNGPLTEALNWHLVAYPAEQEQKEPKNNE